MTVSGRKQEADSGQPIADSRKLSHYLSFHFLKKSTAALLR